MAIAADDHHQLDRAVVAWRHDAFAATVLGRLVSVLQTVLFTPNLTHRERTGVRRHMYRSLTALRLCVHTHTLMQTATRWLRTAAARCTTKGDPLLCRQHNPRPPLTHCRQERPLARITRVECEHMTHTRLLREFTFHEHAHRHIQGR